jgi:hypothetical protein
MSAPHKPLELALRSILGMLTVLTACGETAEAVEAVDDSPNPPIAAPTSSASRVTIALHGDADHLAEIVRFGAVWYTTNSNGVFSSVRLEPDGSLHPLVSHLDLGLDVRCTTADVHLASATLLCSNEYFNRVYRFSVSDPETPVLTHVDVITDAERVPVSDLHVWGDEVWLAAYGAGLWRASIDEAGALSTFELVAEPGNARAVAHDDGVLVVLVADRGVVVFEQELDGGWVERGEVPLDGPLLDLAVDHGRAAVAMGSAGAVTIDLTTLTTEAVVTPRAVVASAALRGDRLALGALSGLFVYALAPDAEPRLFAFSRSGYPLGPRPGTMLDVAFESDDELLVSDWSLLHRYTLAEDGAITEVEVATGSYRAPGEPITVAVRNHGDLEQDIEVELFKRQLGSFTAAADTVFTLDLDPATRDELFPPDSVRRLELRRFTPDGAELEPNFTLIVTTRADHDPAVDGRPAPGMSFPPIQLARWERDPITLPWPSRSLVIFFTDDCQAMWPQIQDAAWLARRGDLDGGAQPIFVTHAPLDAGVSHDRFIDRMRVEDVVAGYYEHAGEAIDEFNHPLVPVYERGFAIERLESAAAHPTDYLVDEHARVLAVEREYRGAHRFNGAP